MRRTRMCRLTVGHWEPTLYARRWIYMRFPDKTESDKNVLAPIRGTAFTELGSLIVRHTTLLILTVLFSIGSTRYRSRYSLGIAK